MSQPQLFPRPVASLLIGLDKLPELLTRVMPLKSKHRGALPGQIRALSTYLTAERDQLPRDYMNQPPLLSAYLNYFMPWNIYRQGRLLAGLQLRIRPGAQIVDLGAGPLTFLLALWETISNGGIVNALQLFTTVNQVMGTIVLAIVVFYFGPSALGRVIESSKK